MLMPKRGLTGSTQSWLVAHLPAALEPPTRGSRRPVLYRRDAGQGHSEARGGSQCRSQESSANSSEEASVLVRLIATSSAR